MLGLMEQEARARGTGLRSTTTYARKCYNYV